MIIRALKLDAEMLQQSPTRSPGYEQDDYDYVLLDAWASDDKALTSLLMTDEYTQRCSIIQKNVLMQTVIHGLGPVYEGTTGMLAHILIVQTVYYTRMKQTHGENPN